MYLCKMILNEDIDAFLNEFESDGDYEDYEIISASWCGSSVLFVLKEKAGA